MNKITDPFLLRFALKNEKASIQVKLYLRNAKSIKIIESILGETISMEAVGVFTVQVDSIKLRELMKCSEVIQITQ